MQSSYEPKTMEKPVVRFALVPIKVVAGDVNGNLTRACKAIDDANRKDCGANLR